MRWGEIRAEEQTQGLWPREASVLDLADLMGEAGNQQLLKPALTTQ
jgi:hypothetical protein